MVQSIMEAVDPTIAFTAGKRERLRKAYNVAVNDDADVFVFEDREYVTGYAKYLLEYLDLTLPRVN